MPSQCHNVFRYNNPVLIDKHQPDKDKGGAAGGKGPGGKGASKKSGGDKEDAKDDASEASGKAPSGSGAAAKDRQGLFFGHFFGDFLVTTPHLDNVTNGHRYSRLLADFPSVELVSF